jgi:hypothetical protein
MAARSVANKITLGSAEVVVYASPRIGHAMKTITENMNLYEGVQLMKVLEAMYLQGKKDGARAAIEGIQQGMKQAVASIPHKNPGKPKKAI